MPISKRDFNKLKRADEIVEFLKHHPHQAFSQYDLNEKGFYYGYLSNLSGNSNVDTRMDDEGQYWYAHKPQARKGEHDESSENN